MSYIVKWRVYGVVFIFTVVLTFTVRAEQCFSLGQFFGFL
jgi:hypothetical protein